MANVYRTKRRIEFSDTDLAGIVHFTRFFVFMESVEHEFLRTLGLSVSMERDEGLIGWPRKEASCEYFSPVRFEEELDITLRILRKGTKSITYQFDFNRGNKVIARGQLTATCCFYKPGERLRSIPIPDFFSDKIENALKSDG